MEQKSRTKFLFWPGFEPRTSRLAVQHANHWATAQPPNNSFDRVESNALSFEFEVCITRTRFRFRSYFSQVQHNETGRWYYTEYANFSIDSESNKYALRLSGGFSGNAGDSLTNIQAGYGAYHGGMSFSTFDADNDKSAINCAKRLGGGWWFNDCYNSCLSCIQNNYLWYRLDPSSSSPRRPREARMMMMLRRST